jgi:hypothetical protein
MEVAPLFRLDEPSARQALREVAEAVDGWRHVASRSGLDDQAVRRMGPGILARQTAPSARVLTRDRRANVPPCGRTWSDPPATPTLAVGRSSTSDRANPLYLGGTEKARVLEVLRPHTFFDDQTSHLEPARATTPAAQVPVAHAAESRSVEAATE